MMTDEQHTLLTEILKLSGDKDATSESLLQDWHLRIKQAYVKHRPTEFRITVGHRDIDRFERLPLKVGDEIRLVSFTTERYIPVKITELPSTRFGYYRGVITNQLVKDSRFESGDSVYFSEDQVVAPTKPTRRRRPPSV
ncbi:hypothetical protein H0484_04180 [Pusillimonas sp. CC-YST705]|uniref:Uncharacterized protein n=1 Tax=Mesopusillimonas faecipullorum TaxID=2755040 RepID=A0ABS8CA87_9BURK|nr:hypothetical protein [Mesopusillimonas faecipullorum]MCB5362954.1 hypothetical protein [Mesopusillimonas faecipullorum]